MITELMGGVMDMTWRLLGPIRPKSWRAVMRAVTVLEGFWWPTPAVTTRPPLACCREGGFKVNTPRLKCVTAEFGALKAGASRSLLYAGLCHPKGCRKP